MVVDHILCQRLSSYSGRNILFDEVHHLILSFLLIEHMLIKVDYRYFNLLYIVGPSATPLFDELEMKEFRQEGGGLLQ